MGESEPPQQAPRSGAARQPAWPTNAELDADADRAARAAAELGLEVPDGFVLMGLDSTGKHTALNSGTADDIKIGIAILGRLDGASVEECLAGMTAKSEAGPRPEWWPPDDWRDTEAMDAWLAERVRHPEWPNAYNGPGDWGLLLAGIGSSLAGLASVIRALAPTMNLRERRLFAEFVVHKAAEQNVTLDPADIIRAFERTAPAIDAADPPSDEGGGNAEK
jgi:hypothetical protein